MRNHYRLLIVEDESDLADSLKDLLSEDYSRVDVAKNGQVALEMMVAQPYHLVIADVVMPVMSGHEFLRQLRLKGVHTPLIFMTGNGTKDLVQSAIKLGAVDFIDKPISIETLKEIVEATLQIEQHKRNISDLQRDPHPDSELIRNEQLALGIKQVSRDKLLKRQE